MKITFSAKFGLFAEIQAAGYHHGATFFYGLKKAGRSYIQNISYLILS